MPFNLERREGVVVVTMAGTSKANVQNDAFLDELERTFDRLGSEFPECAVVLTAAGSVFSAGLDFESVWKMFDTAGEAAVREFFVRYRRINLRIFDYPRPTIAAMNGHAFAGGMVLALTCDYRICARGARLALNEVPIGIPMPAAYVELIRYQTGGAGTAATLFGLEMDAEAARRNRFVHAVAEPEEVLRQAVELAARVSGDCIAGYEFTKRALQAPTRAALEGDALRRDEGLAEVILSEGARRARARRYQELKGRPAPWLTADR
jgi:enoyl-CoA hydratase